jgi:glutamyl-tRNA(Gln) amidotransferase subunit E
MDYNTLGFKAGLEIHQQLETHKLFCSCPSEITDKVDYSFERSLRPTQSELGDVDKAALAEARKQRRFLYTASNSSTCLVEADEEPPHQANSDAIDVCLTMALLTDALVVDELHFMRKIVIDGSNTSGFQRTGLLAIDGHLDDVSIQTIALEEDAARKIDQKGNLVNYGLDRLGIPLIEIATGPDMKDPTHVREVAERIGLLLRATGMVKKGLGTIRQDLNVSIRDSSRVEIKGVQSLSSIEHVAKGEVVRQQMLLDCKNILLNRKSGKQQLKEQKIIDVTSFLEKIDSKMFKKLLKQGVAKGVKLPGFAGLLKKDGFLLGRELSGYAKVASGIGGIIHSDELPGYGMNEDDVKELESIFHIDPSVDAFVIALGEKRVVDSAIDAVLVRADLSFTGVVPEVRRALLDNSTEYLRPLPGAARMYPETDVQPVVITHQRLERLQKHLPERPEEKLKRFMEEYDLHEEHTKQLLSSGFESDFEDLVKDFPGLQQVIVRIFLNTLPELDKENISTNYLTIDMIRGILTAVENNVFSKEGIPLVLGYLLKHPSVTLQQAVDECGLRSVDTKEIEQFTQNLVKDRIDFINQRGMNAVGPLMGIVMKEFRGKADGALISRILKQEVDRIIKEQK